MSRHLLVIGAQRSGTTWLAGVLDSHPQITQSRPSRPEPKVFLDPERAARGREWYRDTYFAHVTDELLLLDKSTSYLEYPEAAARAVEVLGDPLAVAQLPADIRHQARVTRLLQEQALIAATPQTAAAGGAQ